MSGLILFLLHLFQPEPPVVIARDTTYIRGPLLRDGLPDYEAYLRDLGRDGVTPENNAAALMWQATWPHNLECEDYEPMLKELGLKETPSAKNVLQLFDGEANRKRIADGLHLNIDDTDPIDIIRPANEHSWTSHQCPPLVEWVAANKRPIDLLVEAARRPRFYSPSPSYLNQKRELLINVLLPGSQNIREVARAIGIRAMCHTGENRLTDAWSDVMAVHRLARLASQGQALVDQLVAVSISESACRETLAVLSSDRLPIQLARRIQHDLDGLPRVCHVADRMNTMERLCALDAAVYLKRHGILHGLGVLAEDISALDDDIARSKSGPNITKPISFDANVVMRRLNSRYDRLVAIAQLPHKTRKAAYAKFWTELEADGRRVRQPLRLVAATFSRNIRSELIAAIIANLLIPALDAANAAEDRAHTTLQLTRVAAALAVYRADHRNYPATLDKLVPAILKGVSIDIYNNSKLIYKRTDHGYLLYSTGENGVDDGGDNHLMSLIAGRAIENSRDDDPGQPRPEVSQTADDISVIVPRPPFKLPKKMHPTIQK
jgi:hypothetical protein